MTAGKRWNCIESIEDKWFQCQYPRHGNFSQTLIIYQALHPHGSIWQLFRTFQEACIRGWSFPIALHRWSAYPRSGFPKSPISIYRPILLMNSDWGPFDSGTINMCSKRSAEMSKFRISWITPCLWAPSVKSCMRSRCAKKLNLFLIFVQKRWNGFYSRRWPLNKVLPKRTPNAPAKTYKKNFEWSLIYRNTRNESKIHGGKITYSGIRWNES